MRSLTSVASVSLPVRQDASRLKHTPASQSSAGAEGKWKAHSGPRNPPSWGQPGRGCVPEGLRTRPHRGQRPPWRPRVPLPHSPLHLGASPCQDDSGKGRNPAISQLESAVKISVFWRLGGCQTHAEPNWVLKMCNSCGFSWKGGCVCPWEIWASPNYRYAHVPGSLLGPLWS